MPTAVLALDFTLDTTRYTDVATTDFATRLAVSTLTDANVLYGNPDGSFRPGATLNRAEFVTIAMRMSGRALQTPSACFPDVQSAIWYSSAVCTAKALGFVNGNVVNGVAATEWLFEPERPVRYVEALKILSEVFEVRQPASTAPYFVTTGEWYEPYLAAAVRDNTQLRGVLVSSFLTRAQMAQLSMRFLANDQNELSELDAILQAQSVSPDSSNPTTVPGFFSSLSSSSSSTSSVSSSVTSMQSSSVSATNLDPDTNVSQQSDILLLGDTTPVIGAANFFSEQQPLIVNTVIIELAQPASAVTAFKVYTNQREFLGTATRVSAQRFELPLSSGVYTIPKGQEVGMYARAIIKADDSGGVSGQIVQFSQFGIETTGVWSDAQQIRFTSEVFLAHQTAAAAITNITNGGSNSDILIAGTNVRLGSFTFAGTKVASQADLFFTDLNVQADIAGSVTISNVELQDLLNKTRVPCAITGTKISCNSIPESFGSFENAPRTFAFFGDITLGGGSDASLQLRINEAGTPFSPGDIFWSDGFTNFTWLPGETPVTRSTFFDR